MEMGSWLGEKIVTMEVIMALKETDAQLNALSRKAIIVLSMAQLPSAPQSAEIAFWLLVSNATKDK